MRRVHVMAIAALLTVSTAARGQQALGRVLGVFDDVTGQPVAGVDVIDIETGTKAVTSASGVVTLAFLRAGTSLLQLRKLGYLGKLLPVVVSPSDTASVTVVLIPLMQTLPAVVTKARQPGDTVRKLELSGFYDRKRSTGAPEHAFVTAEQIARWNLSLVSDVSAHTGRGFGQCDAVYIDGTLLTSDMQLNAGSRLRGAAPFRKKASIDVLVAPDDIQGIEMYRTADAPSAYRPPPPPGCPPDRHFILIWLK
jgi:hypothetical protein